MTLDPRLMQIILGREDVSAYVENPSFSAVDPGGFEASSLEFTRNLRVPRGTDVKFLYGQSIAWEGRVNEVNRQLSAQPVTQLACQGYGARYKENGQAMIFIDRDQSKWGSMSTARKVALNATRSFGDIESLFDPGQVPSLFQFLTGAWSIIAQDERYYDAGPAVSIATMYYEATPNVNINTSDVQWDWRIGASTDDILTGATDTGNLRAVPGLTASGYFSAGNVRYGHLTLIYGVAGGGEGVQYGIHWKRLAVYGNHGITRTGPDPGGFSPDQIAAYVQRAAYPTAKIDSGIIESAGYVIPHLVYYTPVPWEQMLSDAAKMAGFHYGTWEGPSLHFRAYPGVPTCWTSAVNVDDLQLNDSLDGLYNVAQVSYADPAGSSGIVTCTRSIGALGEQGITRTLYLDIGLASSTTATAFGNIVLAISENNAGTTGSFTTKTPVLAKGGDKPAFMMRPGIDRLKVTDLTADGDGQTEFIVKHIEATIAADGITTQVQLGRGADLIETLQSRLAAGLLTTG